MNPSRLLTLTALIFSLSLWSCEKERIDLPWQMVFTQPGYVLSDISQSAPNQLRAVGGVSWYEGLSVESTDGGITWEAGRLGDKQLFGIDSRGTRTTAVGIDGYLYEKNGTDEWQFVRLSRWDILRDVVDIGDDLRVAVGGVAFNSGVIYRLDQGRITEFHSFPHELQWVEQLADGSLLAGGYGLVLKSSDRGVSWSSVPLEGDFFQDAAVGDDGSIWVVGYAGGVWKSENGGNTWKKQRGPKSITRLPGLRCVDFRDNRTGIIAGDNGNALLTNNGGDDWVTIGSLPQDVDFYAVTIDGQHAWLVGSRGAIVRIELAE